ALPRNLGRRRLFAVVLVPAPGRGLLLHARVLPDGPGKRYVVGPKNERSALWTLLERGTAKCRQKAKKIGTAGGGERSQEPIMEDASKGCPGAREGGTCGALCRGEDPCSVLFVLLVEEDVRRGRIQGAAEEGQICGTELVQRGGRCSWPRLVEGDLKAWGGL
ncbi:unnamed protein product, partial [Ectocarpus sp. 13 AM-2016]